jgi:glyoxylase-like metal-dependent hydrolase (beta-lactamase superfamily II)
MFRSKIVLLGSAVSFAFACVSTIALAESAEALLKRASNAMGATNVKTLRYTAEGTGYTFGQAYVPESAWPKITVHSQVRTINYDTGSMREDFVLSRAEPKGGGGYPLSGEQRNEWYVSGGYAWNVTGGNPVPGPRFVDARRHQLWITPIGVVKAAIRNKGDLQFQNKSGKSVAAVSFTEPGQFMATAYFTDDFLVERVESRIPDPVLGVVPVVTTYSEYRDFGGVKHPTRIRQSQGGHPVLDVTVKEVQPNAAADIALPDAVKSATERVTTEKVAEGVWFVAGGSHNSVAIEMKDHLVLVEAPLNDARSGPVIDQVRQLAPGKPIRFVINSHSHFDHSGGLRAAAAEGATIVTQSGSKAYFDRAFAVRNTISPDRFAKSGKKAKVVGVKDTLRMSDGARTLDILRITGGGHSDTFLMVYLPKEKLLIEADAYTPLAPNAAPPATPNANNVNLIENIERRKLAVDRILPLHGRVVPVSELYSTAKRTPKQ